MFDPHKSEDVNDPDRAEVKDDMTTSTDSTGSVDRTSLTAWVSGHAVLSIVVAAVVGIGVVAADQAWKLPLIGVATLVVVSLTLATYYFQLVAMRQTVAESTKQRHLESMLAVTSLLQSDEQRASRGRLLEFTKDYRLGDGPTPDVTNSQYAKDCDNIGHVMQTLGFYTRKRLFERELVLENWCHAASECWRAAEPYVRERRIEERWDVWADFEWLGIQADDWLAKARAARGPAVSIESTPGAGDSSSTGTATDAE